MKITVESMPKKKLTQRERILLSEVDDWEDWRRLFFYYMVEEKNQSIVFAHMAANQKPPGGMTDNVFMSGQLRFGSLPEKERERIAKAARKNGYNPKPSDVYMPTLASKTGDRRAFFNVDSARGDIKKLAEQNRFDVDVPGVKVDGHKDPEKSPHEFKRTLHPRLIRRHMARKIQEDPGLAQKKNKRELVESIVDQHARKPKVS